MATPAPTSVGAPAEDRMARLTLASRLAVGFLLDCIAITRGDGDVIDTLLLGAIIQANVQEINRRADLQVSYADEAGLPPDEVRRPVSMNALASSLDLPFETVRRRVKALARDGWCRFTGDGVIVPTAVLADPKYYVDAYRMFERLRDFYFQLSDLGLLGDLPPRSVELPAGAFPVRAVARLVGAYVLRVVESLGVMGDLLDGLLVLEMFRSNVEHLAPEAVGREPGGMINDAERAPITVSALAARLGHPAETVRRHVAGLMGRGVCVRVKGGLIVPVEALRRPALQTAMAGNAANLQRLFAALSQLGVLKIWDASRPQTPSAAIPQNG
jgi:DNA-binding Lrp family transcriptional regulator